MPTSLLPDSANVKLTENSRDTGDCCKLLRTVY